MKYELWFNGYRECVFENRSEAYRILRHLQTAGHFVRIRRVKIV